MFGVPIYMLYRFNVVCTHSYYIYTYNSNRVCVTAYREKLILHFARVDLLESRMEYIHTEVDFFNVILLIILL